MKKLGFFLAALIAAFAFASQGAEAGYRKKKIDPRVKAVSIIVPAGATAGYFAMNDWKWKWNKASTSAAWVGSGGAYVLTSGACAAVSPILATVIVNRELTAREAHTLAASCFVPIIGGLIVNAIWDAHPEWEKPVRPVRKARRR